MSIATIRAVSRHEIRLVMSDPMPFAVMALMPILIAFFIAPALQAMLVGDGSTRVSGAEVAVPAMTVMFGFFLTGNIGQSFFYEHRWNTWDRVRAEAITPVELVAGKAFPYVVLAIVYQIAVFAAGVALLGFRIQGPILLMTLTMVPFAIMLVTFAFALVAACRSARQLQAYSNLLGLLFAGLAGAITPLHLLPGWAQAVAPWTPGYWVLRGLTDVVQGADPMSAGLRAGAALLAFSAVFALVGLSQFNVSDRKIYVS